MEWNLLRVLFSTEESQVHTRSRESGPVLSLECCKLIFWMKSFKSPVMKPLKLQSCLQ
nr:hypothetical protein Iba_scaffold79783CG0010 [Ipomoea batatas]